MGFGGGINLIPQIILVRYLIKSRSPFGFSKMLPYKLPLVTFSVILESKLKVSLFLFIDYSPRVLFCVG